MISIWCFQFDFQFNFQDENKKNKDDSSRINYEILSNTDRISLQNIDFDIVKEDFYISNLENNRFKIPLIIIGSNR